MDAFGRARVGFKAMRNIARVAILALAGIAGAAALSAAPAQAQQTAAAGGWSLCNATSYVVEAATARPDGRAVMVRGWDRVRPGECVLVAQAPLARGVHYVFARTSTAHRGGRRQWGGETPLCVNWQSSFQVESQTKCQAIGLDARNFREVRINKRDGWRTYLSEAEPYSMDRARSAGFARLLADAGYDSGIGSDPRRMAAAIGRFRAEARVAPNATQDQLVDALESLARRRSGDLGLTLCNRTEGRLWTAIARRRGEGWESRGWWVLAPTSCSKTIDDPLVQGVYFVHAVLETKAGERYLAAPGEAFCTARTRFAVIGREACERRHYDISLFTPISPQGREGMVVDFNDRDFLAPGLKPRRIEMPNQMAKEDAKARPSDAGIARGVTPATAGAPVPRAPQPAIGDGAGRPPGGSAPIKPDAAAQPAPRPRPPAPPAPAT
ncbi:MAG: DUF1036 domain-containing protein [Caulobacterales bacterium]